MAGGIDTTGTMRELRLIRENIVIKDLDLYTLLTGQGKIKRISKVVLRLFNTVGAKCGPSLTNLETVPFRTTSSDMDSPVSTLLAGDKTVEFTDDYNSDGFIFVKQDQPLPLSLLALYLTFVICMNFSAFFY